MLYFIQASAFGAVLLVSACANQLAVTYNCDPTGASLHEEGDHSLGYCPTTLNYAITEYDREQGFVLLRGITARWVSGAYSSVSSIRADLVNGHNQQFTFTRPTEPPGYEIDARFALEYERNIILRRQEQAQRDQAYWSMMNALYQQQQLNRQAHQSDQGLQCTSRQFGNTIQSECY